MGQDSEFKHKKAKCYTVHRQLHKREINFVAQGKYIQFHKAI